MFVFHRNFHGIPSKYKNIRIAQSKYRALDFRSANRIIYLLHTRPQPILFLYYKISFETPTVHFPFILIIIIIFFLYIFIHIYVILQNGRTDHTVKHNILCVKSMMYYKYRQKTIRRYQKTRQFSLSKRMLLHYAALPPPRIAAIHNYRHLTFVTTAKQLIFLKFLLLIYYIFVFWT